MLEQARHTRPPKDKEVSEVVTRPRRKAGTCLHEAQKATHCVRVSGPESPMVDTSGPRRAQSRRDLAESPAHPPRMLPEEEQAEGDAQHTRRSSFASSRGRNARTSCVCTQAPSYRMSCQPIAKTRAIASTAWTSKSDSTCPKKAPTAIRLNGTSSMRVSAAC